MLKKTLKFLKGLSPRTRCTRKISRLLGGGDLPAAAELATKTLKKYPTSAVVIILYAKVCSAQENHDEVKNALARISELRSAPQELLFDAALMLQKSGDDELASRFLKHLDEDRRFWRASKALGFQAYNAEDFNEAIEFFARSVAWGGEASWGAVIPAIKKSSFEAAEAARKWLVEFDYTGRYPEFYFKMLSIFDQKLDDFESSKLNIRKAKAVFLKASVPALLQNGKEPPLPPRFLIIGAMKCGTTTLHQLIAKHPMFVAPIDKEIQFFQFPWLQDSWYLDHFPCLDPSSGYFSGDASPGYYAFDIVERIENFAPDIKLLFIQRDPTDRAISHIRHNNRVGLSSAGVEVAIRNIDQLEKIICDHPESAEKTLLEMIKTRSNCNMYLILGLYEILLRRWRRRFGSEQLKVVNLDELDASPNDVMRDIFEFLGVETVPVTMIRENSGNYIRTDETTIRVKTRLKEFYERVEASTT